MTLPRAELARNTLGVLVIAALIVSSSWILLPFIPGFVWAAMIVVATWPMMRRVESWFRGRRAPAVVVMTVAMLLIFIVPLWLAISVIVENAGAVSQWIAGLSEQTIPDPPGWIAAIPIVGKRIVSAWESAQASGMPELVARLEPYAEAMSRRVLADLGNFGMLVVQFLLTVILSAVFYADGDAWANWLRAFGQRLADERGIEAVVLAGQAIRGVALGVVVTALIQSGLGGLGLVIAGVPFPLLFTAVMLALCIAQLGPISLPV